MRKVSNVKIILIGVAVVFISLLVFAYLNASYMELMIRRFARSQYNDDYTWRTGQEAALFFFLLFGLVSYSCNVITLKKIGRLTVFQLYLQTILDQIAIPIGIFLMVVYNNGRIGMPVLSSLLNPIAIGIVLLIKHAIILARSKGNRGVKGHTSH
jgi:hypothetical protein